MIALHDIRLLVGRGQYHHRNIFRPLIGFDGSEDLQTVHLGQFEIQEHHFRVLAGITIGVKATAKKKVQGFLPILDVEHLVGQVTFLERPERQFRVVGIIFHQQNFRFVDGIHCCCGSFGTVK